MNGAAKGGDDVSRGRSHTHKLSCQHSCKFTRRCQLLLRHASAHSSLRKFGRMLCGSRLDLPRYHPTKIFPQPKRPLLLSSIFPSPSRILAASAKAVASKSSRELLHILQLHQRLILLCALLCARNLPYSADALAVRHKLPAPTLLLLTKRRAPLPGWVCKTSLEKSN